MKKITFAAAVLFLTALLTVSVGARSYTASPYRSVIENYDEAYEAIYEAVSRGEEEVDLTELKITANNIMTIYSDIINSCPEFFYLDKQVRYYYLGNSIFKYVTKLEFKYTVPVDEIASASADYENELNYIVSLIDPSLSDAEKALWVHDYFVTSFAYDEDEEIYDAYSFFKERRGVCQAYSLAYMAVLREVGIEAFMITSTEMNHAWNLVCIDGAWYHVDLVFDDPSPDRAGRVLHDNFLLSDEEIENTPNPHYGWISKFSCGSDKYSDAFWRGVTSRMAYSDGRWYYIDSGALALISRPYTDDSSAELVYAFRDRWYVSDADNRYWVGVYSGVSEFLGYIFVNTPDEIIAYSGENGDISVYYQLGEDEQGYIYGSDIYKNGLEYTLALSPSDSEKTVVRFEIKDFGGADPSLSFPFKDVSKLDNSYAAIKYVYSNGLFNGVSFDRFAPESTLTRAMFVTVLGRLCGIDTEQYGGTDFTDVKEGLWYSPYIRWASREGIVNGVGGGKFEPNAVITHEQMYKTVAYCGEMLGCEADEPCPDELLFSDAGLISDWAEDGVKYCVRNRLIPPGDGKTELKPSAPATREEAAMIIYNLAKLQRAA